MQWQWPVWFPEGESTQVSHARHIVWKPGDRAGSVAPHSPSAQQWRQQRNKIPPGIRDFQRMKTSPCQAYASLVMYWWAVVPEGGTDSQAKSVSVLTQQVSSRRFAKFLYALFRTRGP
jgi:hypothetical protein